MLLKVKTRTIRGKTFLVELTKAGELKKPSVRQVYLRQRLSIRIPRTRTRKLSSLKRFRNLRAIRFWFPCFIRSGRCIWAPLTLRGCI